MKIEIKDHIGVFSDVYTEGFCEHLINEFDRHQENSVGSNRKKSEGAKSHQKDDYQIFSNGKNISFAEFNGWNTENVFFKGLQQCYDAYTENYSTLMDSNLSCNHMKMQKTSPGGGYHVWHAEQANGDHANRGLVYMLYLNTIPIENNGETEFLYQQRRINPVENTMILWPASFTHTHRGNPVYGDKSKYVITGWFKYD